MATQVKCLYNVPATESVRELIFRRTGLQLDNDFATYTFADPATHVTIGTKVRAADGRRSIYAGEITLPLTRLDVGGQLPDPLIWSDNYPNTVNAFADYMYKAFNYYFEDGEFFGVGDAGKVALKRGDVMTAVVNEDEQTFSVEATPQSARWIPGSQLTFRLVTSNANPGQDNFQLIGTPPDGQVGQAYDFTFQVTNGTPPFRFQVLQGNAPVTPSTTTGRMQADSLQAAVGPYNWIMQVTDALGHQATLRCSMDVAAAVLVFNPPSLNPTVSVGVQSSIPLGISGGLPPYNVSVYLGDMPRTVAVNTSALSGVFDGSYTTGQTSRQLALGIRVTDQSNQQVDRLFNITVTNRSDAAIIASLKAKLNSWYATPVGELTDGVTWIDASGHANLQVKGSLAPVNGPRGTDVALSFAGGYAQAFAAVHNYASAFTAVVWAKMGAGSSIEHLISKAATAKGWALTRNNTQVQILAATAAGMQTTAFSGGTLTDGQWHLLFARITPTQDTHRYASFGQGGNALVDGALFDGTIVANDTQVLTLGQAPSGAGHYTGALCDPVLFSDALWSDEIRWFANAGAGRRYWDLIDVPTLTLTGTSADSQVGQSPITAYETQGGVAPYSYRVSGGTLPPGRVLNQDGTITGAYTTGADYTWTVEVTDARGVKATVNDSCLIGWRTLTLSGTYPSAELGATYSADLTIAGGNGVYGNPRSVGPLPNGLSLSVVGNKLRLSGTTGLVGNFSFTAVVDSGDTQTASSGQSVAVLDPVAKPVKIIDIAYQGGDSSTTFVDRTGRTLSAVGTPRISTAVDANGALFLDGNSAVQTPVTIDMPVDGDYDMQVEFYPTEGKAYFAATPYVGPGHYPTWVFGFSGVSDNPGDAMGTSAYFGFSGKAGSWFLARSADGVVQLNQWNRLRGARGAGGSLLIYVNDVLVGSRFFPETANSTPVLNVGDTFSMGQRWDTHYDSVMSHGYLRTFSFTQGRPHLSAAILDTQPDHYWTGELPITERGGQATTALTLTGPAFAAGASLGAEPIKSLQSTGSSTWAVDVSSVSASAAATLECAVGVTTAAGNGGFLLAEASSTQLMRALYITPDMKPGFVLRSGSDFTIVVAPEALSAYDEALVMGRLSVLDADTQRVELVINGVTVATQDVATLPTYTVTTYYLLGGATDRVAGMSAAVGLSGTVPTVTAGKFAAFSRTLSTLEMGAHAKAFRRLSAAPSISGSLPNGMQLTSYSATLSLSGGDGTFVDPRVMSANLPVGLKLAISGSTLVVSGSPQTTFNGNLTLAVNTGDGQTAQLNLPFIVTATDTAAIRRSLRTKVTSFWDFNGDGLDKARAGQHFVRADGQTLTFVSGVNGRQAVEGQHVSYLRSPAMLGVNAVHGSDAWAFGGRFRPVDLGNFFVSVADINAGLKNELMAIGFTTDNAWQGTVRDSAKNDIIVKGPTAQVNDRHHVVMTCDGTTLMLYLDGALLASTVMPQTPLRYTNTLCFTVQNSDPTYHAAAEVSELFYAHDALTATEVGYLANSGLGHTYADFGNEAYLEAGYVDVIGGLAPDGLFALSETSGTSAVNSAGGFGNGTYLNAALGALEAPAGIGGLAARFAGNAGMKLPNTLDLGQGDVTLMAFHRPETWTQYGRVFHLGDSASGNAGAMSINYVTNAGRYMAETFAPSTGASYGAANGAYAPVPTALWGQVALQYTRASKRLAVLWNGLTLEACIQSGNWASGTKAQAYLMRSGLGEYGNGALAQATFFKSLVDARDLCKLTDFALPALSVTLGTWPTVYNQRAWTGTLTVSGGQLPLASVVETTGRLPAGMSVSTVGRTITLSGNIPATLTDSFSLSFEITDAAGAVVTINPTMTVVDTAHLLSRMRFNGGDGTAEVVDDVGSNIWSAVNGATLSATQVYEGTASLSCIIGGVQCATNPLSEVDTRDFTVRGLLYPLASAGNQMILRTGTPGTGLYFEGGALTWYENGVKIFTSASQGNLNAWNSFVLQRANGKIFAAFNGVGETPVTSTVTVAATTVTFALGFNTAGTMEFFNGYMDFVEMFSTADATRIAQLGLIPLHASGTWATGLTQGTPYSSSLTITGGSGNCTPSVSSGALPLGLTQSYAAGQWTISGVPTVSGAFRVALALVSDDGQIVTSVFQGTIAPSEGDGTSDYETEVAKDTPKAWWKMNDVTGTQLTDSSGNGYHGSTAMSLDKLTGPSLLPSGMGRALGLGLGVQAQLPNLFGTNPADFTHWTLEMIIQPMTWPMQSTVGTIVQMGTGGSGSPEFDILDQGDGTFRWRVMASGVQEVMNTPQTYPYGEKYHVVFRVESSNTGSFWVNGVKMGTTTNGNWANNARYWELGSSSFGGSLWGYPFLGYISQVAWYTGALADNRIVAHANAAAWDGSLATMAKGLWKKLEAWYRMEDVNGANVLVDVFGGHNLVVNGNAISKTGKVGNAIRMANGDYASAARGQDMAFSRNFAVVAWIQTDTGVENRHLISKWGGSSGFALGTGGNGTILQINLNEGGTNRSFPLNSNVSIANNGWHFIVMERAFSRFNGYMDQSATAQASFQITMNDIGVDNSVPVTFWQQANSPSTANTAWTGDMDNVALFNEALTNAERAYLATAPAWEDFRALAVGAVPLPASLYTKLVGWWEYDTLLGTVVDRHVYQIPTVNDGAPANVATAIAGNLSPSTTLDEGTHRWYAQHPRLALPNEAVAVLWTRPGSPSAPYPKYMWKGGGTVDGSGNYLLQWNNQGSPNTLAMRASTSNSAYNDASTSALSIGSPYMLLGQRKGANVEMYVNGVKSSSAGLPNGEKDILVTDDNPLTWGYRHDYRDPVQADVFPAMVFRSALTQEEIDFLYNAGNGRSYAQLVAALTPDSYAAVAFNNRPLFYYDTLETAGALHDLSGNGNLATIVDGAAQYRQPSIRPDGVGYAVGLDGYSSFAVPQLISQQTDGWVSFWAKPSFTSGEAMLYSENVSAGPTFQLKASYLNGSGLTWEADNLINGGGWQKQWSGALDPTIAHHVLVTWDATHKCIYVDGVQVVNVAVSGQASYGATAGMSYIGREGRGLNVYTPAFQGLFQGLCGGHGLLPADQAAAFFAAAGGSNTDLYAQAITSRSPAVWWRLNGAIADGTIVPDASGNGNTLQMTVPSADASAQPGPALVKGSASSYYKTGASPAGGESSQQFVSTQSYAVLAWVQTTDTGALREIVSVDDEHGTRLFQLRLTNGMPGFINIRGGIYPVNGSSSIADGKPHLLIGQVDTSVSPNTFSLYVDNVLVGNVVDGNTSGAVGMGVSVGCYNGTSLHDDYQFVGAIGDVALFGRTLSQADMDAIWAAGRSS